MAFLRYNVVGIRPSTNEVIFSDYVPGWDISSILSRADEKYGLDLSWSIVPVHLTVKPDYRNAIIKI